MHRLCGSREAEDINVKQSISQAYKGGTCTTTNSTMINDVCDCLRLPDGTPEITHTMIDQ